MKRIFFLVCMYIAVSTALFAGGKAERETKTGDREVGVTAYREAPMLSDAVKKGELPPVDQRLPKTPYVVKPYEVVGRYGGTLNIREDAAASSPLYRNFKYDRLVRLNGFYGPNKTFVFEPMVADSYKMSEDGKEFTFHIREGLKWSDGEPFTTEDIRFFWEDVMQNDSLRSLVPLGAKRFPGNVQVIDANTFKVVFPQPRQIFLLEQAWATIPEVRWLEYPAHYLKQFHAKYASQTDLNSMMKRENMKTWELLFTDKSRNYTNPDLPQISSWVLAEKLDPSGLGKFKRNPYYYAVDTEGNQLPYIDSLLFLRLEGDAAVAKQIQGEIDYHWVWWSAADYPLLKQNEKVGHYRMGPEMNPRGTTLCIYMNQTTPDPVLRKIFQDVRFRKAVSYAINRKEVVDTALNGLARPAGLTVGETCLFYRPEWGKMYAEYNPTEANRLLDDMGLKWDSKHEYRLRSDGKPLEVVFIYGSTRVMWVPSYELVADYLKRIGINMILQSIEYVTWREMATGNDVQWTTEEWSLSEFNTTYVAPAGRSNWGQLWNRWYTSKGKEGEEPPASVKKIYDLKDKAEAASTLEERVKYLDEAVDIVVKEAMFVGVLGNEYRGSSVHDRVKNVSFEMENVINFGILAYPTAFRHTEQFWIDPNWKP